MKITDIPVKLPTAFASGATAPYITQPLPVPSQIGVNPGRASFTDGFPPLTFEQLAAGGDPPFGADFNGLMYQITIWLRWAQAGGVPLKYDATFSAAVGGYPQGALLQSATAGHYWISQADDNPTNPDAGGANWTMFPDTLIQQQAGNYAATDTGAVNHVAVALSPVPASLASLVGSPIRFLIAHANTVTNPDININALGAVPMINTDGSVISIAQFSRVGQFCEGYLDPDLAHFQVTSPPKPLGTGSGRAGEIVLWATEIPPAGALECDGSLKNITAYPGLFNVIKTTYGGDGVTTFRLPDYRGTFPRGWDHGRGLDPNAGTRTNRGDGTTGDHVGTNEAWAIGTGPITINNPYINWDPFNYHGSVQQTFLFNGHSGPLTVDMTNMATQIGFVGPPGIPDSANVPNGGLGLITNAYSMLASADGLVVTSASISGTFAGSSTETRPVNIGAMFIIYY